MDASPVKQNPFSLYDFIGYLLPGAYLIFCSLILDATINNSRLTETIQPMINAIVFSKNKPDQEKNTANQMEVVKNSSEHKIYGLNITLPENHTHSPESSTQEKHDSFQNKESTYPLGVIIAVSLMFLYILGHVISLLSNILIEKLKYIKETSNPFKYLLTKQVKKHSLYLVLFPIPDLIYKLYKFSKSPKDTIKKYASFIELIAKCITWVCVFVINFIFWLIPLAIGQFFMLAFATETEDPKNTVVSNLHKSNKLESSRMAICKIQKVCKEHLSQEFQAKQSSLHLNYLLHLVITKSPNHCWKIHNYVALYGFMRNMLMANIFVFYIFAIISFANGNLFKSPCLIALFSISFLNSIFLYGYIKYIRRYAEEIIFASCAIKIEKTTRKLYFKN